MYMQKSKNTALFTVFKTIFMLTNNKSTCVCTHFAYPPTCMRAKASLEFLQFGAAFANSVTARWDESDQIISCKGPNSIFAALGHCIPTVVNTVERKGLKGAFTEIQLNKHLARNGYRFVRYRYRLNGSKNKWSKRILT